MLFRSIVVLIVLGSLGFSGGLLWAGIGTALVLALLIVVGNRRLSMGLIAMAGRMPGPLGKAAPKLEAAYESWRQPVGRYDGEEYEYRPPCRPDRHDFAMSGKCWRCGHSRDDLLSEARKILALHEQGKL